MKTRVIARRYGEAFFKAILAEDLDKGFQAFQAFVAFYHGYPDLGEILRHPAIALDRKIELIDRVCCEDAIPLMREFVHLLLRRRRLDLLPLIVEEVEQLYRREKRIVAITVKSAVPLLLEEREALREKFSHQYPGRVEIRELLDPSLLGGLSIYFEERVIDGSVRTRLHHFHEAIEALDQYWLAGLEDAPGPA